MGSSPCSHGMGLNSKYTLSPLSVKRRGLIFFEISPASGLHLVTMDIGLTLLVVVVVKI
jgi:hypothetical protein